MAEEQYKAEHGTGRTVPAHNGTVRGAASNLLDAPGEGALADFDPVQTAERLRWKTRFFLALVIVSQPLGNLSLTLGMKHRALDSPLDYIAAIFSPHVALGIVLLIVWLLSRMTLLSWADLSYVLPITSVGYIVTTVMARVVLHEQISLLRWSGTLLIVTGTALVGMTNANTKIDDEKRP